MFNVMFFVNFEIVRIIYVIAILYLNIFYDNSELYIYKLYLLLIVSFGFVVIAYTRFNNIVCFGVACLIIISSVVEIGFVCVVLHVLLLRLCNDNVIIYMKYARCMH